MTATGMHTAGTAVLVFNATRRVSHTAHQQAAVVTIVRCAVVPKSPRFSSTARSFTPLYEQYPTTTTAEKAAAHTDSASTADIFPVHTRLLVEYRADSVSEKHERAITSLRRECNVAGGEKHGWVVTSLQRGGRKQRHQSSSSTGQTAWVRGVEGRAPA